MTAPLRAGSTKATMHVSVQVIASATVKIDAQPTIDVTAADVARGYVDLTAPMVLHGRTNSRNGYLLQVVKTSEEFNAVDLELPDASLNVGSSESWIQRPYVAGGEVVPVHARLYLAPVAMPGPHAIPVSFSASPL